MYVCMYVCMYVWILTDHHQAVINNLNKKVKYLIFMVT
jgi:hypothetical protein